MNNPKEASSLPSIIDLMGIRPAVSAQGTAKRAGSMLARLRHRFRMATVFCELIFARRRNAARR